ESPPSRRAAAGPCRDIVIGIASRSFQKRRRQNLVPWLAEMLRHKRPYARESWVRFCFLANTHNKSAWLFAMLPASRPRDDALGCGRWRAKRDRHNADSPWLLRNCPYRRL